MLGSTLTEKGVVGRRDDCATGCWGPCMCVAAFQAVFWRLRCWPHLLWIVDTSVDNGHA